MTHHIIFNGGELSPHFCTFIQSYIFALHLDLSQSGVLGQIVKTIELKGGAALKQVTSFLSQVSFDARSDLSRDTKAHFIISLLSNSRRDPGKLSTSTFRVLFTHHVHLRKPP